MGILNRISSSESSDDWAPRATRPDRFDPFLGDPDLRGAYQALTGGDWNRVERFLDTSNKAWLFNTIITGPVVDLEIVTFERWCRFKDGPRARTLLAAARIRDAFAAHGIDHAGAGGTAGGLDETAEDHNGSRNGSADGSHQLAPSPDLVDRLVRAEDELFQVIAHNPTMPDPWVFLLASGRGLRLDLEELRSRFDSAHSLEPFRPDACRLYIQSLAEKWGGSDLATFDFARWVEQKAPPASPAREALPIAHIEYGLLQGGERALVNHLARPEVSSELMVSLLGFLRSTPRPAFTEVLGVLNAYALAISADGPETSRLLADTFHRIDNRPTVYPWSLYGSDVTHAFTEIQAEQLKVADRY